MSDAVVPARKPSRFAAFLAAFLSVPSAAIALAVFTAMCLAALLAPWIAPQNPYDLASVSILDNLIEPGDFEEGMTAAAAIGDDKLTGGRVSSENFTHGTSAQRSAWLRRGLETGDSDQCDTFADLRR